MSIKTLISSLTLAAFLTGPVMAQEGHSEAKTAQMMIAADEAMQTQDCKKAEAALLYLWNDTYLPKADNAKANELRFQRIICALVGDEPDVKTATALAEENIKRPDTDVRTYALLGILRSESDPTAIPKTLLLRLEAHPEDISLLPESEWMSLLGEAEKNLDAYAPLLRVMEKQGFEPENQLSSEGLGMWHLALARKTTNPEHRAIHIAGAKRGIVSQMMLYGDGRLVPESEPTPDMATQVKSKLERTIDYISKHDNEFVGAIMITMDQQMLNQHDALIGFTGAIIENFNDDIMTLPGASYVKENYIASRAEALADAGRHDEALVAFEEGYSLLADQPMDGFMTTYLNYLTDQGQEVRALALMETLDFDAMDADTRNSYARVEACAAYYAGDTARSDKAIASLPETDESRLKPYMCRGESDKGAALLIKLMESDDSRDTAIQAMQNGLSSIAWSERDQQMIDRLDALKKRPDVLAAAKKHQIVIRQWNVRI